MPDLSKSHPVENSNVGKALVRLLEEANPPPPGENPCTAMYPQCPIAPGIEDLFRSQLAHTVICHLWRKKKPVSFHDVIYSPHATKENGGFDLSIGQFDLEPRIRTMQKLINLRQKVWCDQPWNWSTDDDRTALYQLCSLFKTYLDPINKQMHEPFLVINVCFCLHEFRRMGKPGIPGFMDLKRTVVVDLRDIANCSEFAVILGQVLEVLDLLSNKKRKADHPNFKEKLKSFQTRLKVSFDPDNPTPRVAAFECNGKKIDSMPIWTLTGFLDHIASKIPGR
jgi:hypothetical protein